MAAATEIIDSLEFARNRLDLHGEVSLTRLERLTDSLFGDTGSLAYRLRGIPDAHGRPRIRLTVSGEISLVCQRCLGRLPFPLAVESDLLVLDGAGGNTSPELEDLDGIPADPETDVWALVEDEVLLAIPFAPRHAEGTCSAAAAAGDAHAASPFEVLNQIRRSRIRN